MSLPLPLSGYVLAGGRSSRMGSDKALRQLAGRSLAERCVSAISSICERVRIVGAQPELGQFAPTVRDQFIGCGPLGGIEAALRDITHDATHEWVFILPVDLPFVPHGLLYQWVHAQRLTADETMRVSFLEAGGYPQPLIAVLHHSLLGIVQAALRSEQYRVMQVYRDIAQALAPTLHVPPEKVVQRSVLQDGDRLLCGSGASIPWAPSKQDLALRDLWFSNLNTPEEFAAVEDRFSKIAASNEGNLSYLRTEHHG